MIIIDIREYCARESRKELDLANRAYDCCVECQAKGMYNTAKLYLDRGGYHRQRATEFELRKRRIDSLCSSPA